MARCCMCNDSGWFLRVSNEGLCESCEVVWKIEVPRQINIIEQSVEIAQKT